VSASVNLPLHHKVQRFSSGTDSTGWFRKKGRKPVVCVGVCLKDVILPKVKIHCSPLTKPPAMEGQ